jgi:CO/xanthine dehydrogenase Mo-binding subunit
MPKVDILITEDAPSTCNPLGIKGGGEGGVAGVGAVVASAVDDALGGTGHITRIPITPQTVKSIIDDLEASRVSGDRGARIGH